MLVRDCMSANPATVKSTDSLATAKTRMKAGGFRRLPVVDQGKLVGIVGAYDLRKLLDRLDGISLHDIPVSAAMTPDPVTVSSMDTLEHAVTVALDRQVGGLPVVDNGRLVGIITARDLWIAEPRPLREWEPMHETHGLLGRIRRRSTRT